MKVSLLAKAQKQIFPGLMLGGIMGGEIPSDVASKHFCPSVNGQPVFMLRVSLKPKLVKRCLSALLAFLIVEYFLLKSCVFLKTELI